MNDKRHVLLLVGVILITLGYGLGIIIFHNIIGAMIISLGFIILIIWLSRTCGKEAIQHHKQRLERNEN